jgi:phage-related baseplate assembly protein
VVVNVIGQSSGPGGELLSEISDAVAAVRPLGISYTVVAPTLLSVAVAGTLTIASGYTASAVVAAANAAVAAYIDSIGLSPTGTSTTLSYGRVFAILFSVPGVANVDGLTLNGTSGTDIVAPFGEQIVAGACTLTA